LAGVWDADRKREVSTALMASTKPYAAEAVRGVDRALDAYAQGWVAMHTEACAATRLRGEQSEELLDLRIECLSERREELKALVDILLRRDTKVVEKAVQAAEGLTGLDACANTAALKAPVRLPNDATTRVKADELRKKLAQAKALEDAGKYAEGLPIAAAAVTEAKGLQYRPIEAEALHQLAFLQMRAGNLKAADRTLREATLAAQAGRHDYVLARAWIELVYIGYRQGNHEQSQQAAQYAFAALERFGGTDDLRARLFNNLGLALDAEGKYTEALKQHQRALEISERTLGPEHRHVAASLANTAIVFRHLGQYDRAFEYLQRALAINEKVLGPAHPEFAADLTNLANVLSSQGKYEQGLTYHQRAVVILEKALGPEHPWVAAALSNAGASLLLMGQYEQALSYEQRALAIREHSLGPVHPDVAISLVNLAYGLSVQGKNDQALIHARRALDIRERAFGPKHAEVATALGRIGTVLEKQGKYGDALTHYQRALAITESALGPSHSEAANLVSLIGGALRLQGKYRDALSNYERALDICEKTIGSQHPTLALALTGIGETYLAMRVPSRAVAPLERALSLRESQPGEPILLATTRFALARALRNSQHDLKRARELAEQAREVYAGIVGSKTELAKVDAWLRENKR
jgi:tetratricopeptide (TPR) repeat protein